MDVRNSNETHDSKTIDLTLPDSTYVHGLAIALENATCAESGKFHFSHKNDLDKVDNLEFLTKFKQISKRYVSTTVLNVKTKHLAIAYQTFQLQAFTI